MANAFDRFDAPAQRAPEQSAGNPFDAFDQPAQAAQPAPAPKQQGLSTTRLFGVGPSQDAEYLQQPTAEEPEQQYDSFTEATGKSLQNVPERFQQSFGGLVQMLGEDMDQARERHMQLSAQRLGITPNEYKALAWAGQEGLIDPKTPIPEALESLKSKMATDLTPEQQKVVADMGIINPQDIAETGEQLRRDAQSTMVPVNAEPGSLESYGSAAIASIAEMTPALVASALTRNPAVGMSMIGGQVTGESYGTARDKGLSVDESQRYAVAQAAAEAIPEYLPISRILKPGANFFRKVLETGAAESVQEGVTAALQAGIDKGTINPDMTWAEARSLIGDSMIVGGLAGPGMVAVTEPLVRMRNKDEVQGGAGIREPEQATAEMPQEQAESVTATNIDVTPTEGYGNNPFDQFDQPVTSRSAVEAAAETGGGDGQPFSRNLAGESVGGVPVVTAAAGPQQSSDDGTPLQRDSLTESGTGVFRVPVDQIQVDPEQYQFRSRVNEQGVDKRLSGVEQWDDNRAGSVLLHRRADGSLYVADGHHRVDLAKRLGQGEINARVVDEADGVDVATARVEAAMNNIADGKAEPLDVAKVFRDSGAPAGEVREAFNLPNNQVVRDGEALANLSDNVFGMVSAGQMGEKDGAAIGAAFSEPGQQEAAADAFTKVQPETDYQRQLLVNEIRAAEFAEAQGEQGGLFGDDPQEISLMQQRLQVLDALRQRLNSDKRLFKSLNDNADRAGEAGNQIATEANESITKQSARSLDLIGRVTTTPALNEMVNRAARRVYDGDKKSEVVKDLKQELMAYEQGATAESSGRPSPAPRRQPADEQLAEPGSGERVPEQDPAGSDQAAQPESGQQEEVAPALNLEAQTEEQLAERARAREEAQQAETQQRRTEEQRAQADEQVDSFTLTGSDRTADVAMAAGQDDMFVSTPASREVEKAGTQTDTNPTDGQKEAGNYRKGRVRIQGLDIAIENPKGSTRSGTDPDGNRWESTMAHHYGDIKGTQAADGDNLDVFIGPYPEIDQVFVIDQPNADGSFDEHKVMLGFANEADAREGYLANYEDGWTVGPITRMSMDEFKAWVKEGDTTKPLAEQKQNTPADAFLDGVNLEKLNYTNGLKDVAAKVGVEVRPGTPRQQVIEQIKAKFPDRYPQQQLQDTSAPVIENKRGERFRNTRNSGERFHGSSAEISSLDDFKYTSENIYGQGFYTTDAADIASGYGRKGGGGSPTLYKVSVKGEPKLYDLDAGMTPEIRNDATDVLGDLLDEGAAYQSLGEAMDDARANATGEMVSADTVQEMFDELRARMEARGYRGYRHTGGDKTDNPQHDVRIYWNPTEDLTIERADFDAYRERADAASQDEEIAEPAFSRVGKRQTDTEAFKRWFGDSKVVDENGAPLVVYHGTAADIAVFEPSNSGEYGPGIYLSYRPESAQKWASIAGGRNSGPTNTMPVYVRMEKPYETSKADLQEMTLEEDADGEPIGMREVHRRLKSQGYDGIIGTGLTDSDVQIIAFRPEQIKSAIGNSGTFDPNDPDIRYRRTPGQRTESLTKAQAESAIDGLMKGWKGAPKVNVAESISEFPKGLRDAIRTAQAESDMRAVFWNDQVYVLAPRVPNRQALQEVILHEVVGHYGLRQMMGSDLKPLLNQVYMRFARSDEAKRIIRNYFPNGSFNASNSEHRQTVGEELLAHLAETNQHPKLWNRIVSAVREGLRKLGFTLELSETDLLSILRGAQRTVEQGGISRPSEADINFSRADQTNTEAFRKWFGDSKVVDENGEPLVVYHGTRNEEFNAFNAEKAGTVQYSDWGAGIYFTPIKSTADYYRQEALKNDDAESNQIWEQIERLEKDTVWKNGAPQYPEGYSELLDEFRAARRKASEAEGGRVIPAYVSIKNPHIVGYQSTANPGEGITARENGHDGIIVLDYDGNIDEVIAFHPEQIKSATDNAGTFDPANPDIRFSRTGDNIPTLDADPFGPPSDTIVRRVVSKIADKFTVLKGVQEQIKKAEGQIPEQADAYMAEELFHGKVENDIRLVRERMIEPLTEKMAEYKISLKELDQFLYALHAPERNRVIAERNPQMPDGGSGMANAEAAEIITKVKESGKMAEYRDLAARVHRMLEMRRNILRSAGLLDEDTLGAWEASYKAYVPLKGYATDEAPDGRPRIGKGFAIAGKESQMAGGRKSKAASPVANTISDLSEAILRQRKNEVGQTFLNLVQMYPNDSYWKVYTDENPEVERKPIRVKDPETGKMKVEVREQTVPMAMMSDRYFTTKVDGKTRYIKIEDERLMNAMRNIGPDNNNILVRSLAAVTRVMSSLNTSYNPEFVISNFSRDIQTALLNLTSEQSSDDGKARGKKIAAKTLKDVPTSIRAINASLKGRALTGKAGEWQKHFDQFRADGAKTGWFDMKDVDGQMKDMEKLVKLAQGGVVSNIRKTFRSVTDWVENTNGAIENGVRLSAYVNAIEAGIPRAQAASLAKNMTVNFNRRGELGTTMNAVYMFANASVQGTNNFVRTLGRLNGHKGDRIWRRMNAAQKIAAGMAVGGFMLSIMNRLGAGEDDDGVNWWDKVPDYIKERNIVIMKSLVGGDPGEYWTIPLPYGYNIFPVIGTQAEHLAFSENQSAGDAAGNVVLAALGSFSPIGFEESNEAYGTIIKNVTPTILRPIASISLNENFMGGPIFKENHPFGTPKPDSSLNFRSTPEAFKILAQKINEATGGNEQMSGAADWSPDVMQYLVAYYGGGAYDFFTSRSPNFFGKLMAGVELEDREIPFWRKLQGKVLPYEDQSKFYDRRDEINQLVGRRDALNGAERGRFVRDYRDKLRLKPLMDATEKRMRNLRKQRDRIEMRDDLSLAQKDERLQEIEQRVKREVDRFNERYNEADD